MEGPRPIARQAWAARALEQMAATLRSADLMAVWTKGVRLVLSLLTLTILTALTGGVLLGRHAD